MNKKRKKILLVGAGIFGSAIVALLCIYLLNYQYRNRIPEVPDSSVLSLAVMNQVQAANKKAHHKLSSQNLGELGMAYHSSANYNQASQCYQLAINKNKTDWKWSYYLGYLNLELGENDLVIENFIRVTKINPDNNLAWYYLGEAYRNIRRDDLAEKAFLKIINVDNVSTVMEATRNDRFPMSVYAKFQLAKIYFDTSRPEMAEKKLFAILGTYGLFGPAIRLLGNIYKMKGSIAQGEEYTIRANDLFPFSPPVDTLIDKLALMSRSELYLMKKIDEANLSGYDDWAIELVNQGLSYIPENKNMISKAIEVYLGNNMKQKAVGLVEQHISSFTDNFLELITAGKLFFRKDLYRESIEYLTNALKLRSDEPETYKFLAVCYWKLEDIQKAQELLIEAAEVFRDNDENLADILFILLQFGNIEQTNHFQKQLKQISPQHPKVQKLNGLLAEKNGNIKAAISFYEKSFDGDPKDKETIDFLGALLFKQEMWNQYIEFYKEVLKFNPNEAEFLEKLGSVLISCSNKSLRNLDEGIKYSIRAFTHKSSPAQIVISSGKYLAVAYAQKGDKQYAIKILERAIYINQITNASEEIKQELEQLYRNIQ
jgi:tetratricopeptide (TPR) repeat protein